MNWILQAEWEVSGPVVGSQLALWEKGPDLG